MKYRILVGVGFILVASTSVFAGSLAKQTKTSGSNKVCFDCSKWGYSQSNNKICTVKNDAVEVPYYSFHCRKL